MPYQFGERVFHDSAAFSNDGFGGLLLPDEAQNLDNFFSLGPNAISPAATQAPDIQPDYWSSIPPPATIHAVSTTIPDQTQLYHNLSADPHFSAPNWIGSTHDDWLAADALYRRARAPQSHERAYNLDGQPIPSLNTGNLPAHNLQSMSMLAAPRNLLTDQLSPPLSHHVRNGSIDAPYPAQFASLNPQRHHEGHVAQDINQLEGRQSQLQRSYTYGTDDAFNSGSYQVSSPRQTEDHVTVRLLQNVATAHPNLEMPLVNSDEGLISPTAIKREDFPVVLSKTTPKRRSQETSPDNITSDDEDSDKPARKRPKAKTITGRKLKRTTPTGKNVSAARARKNRKILVDEQANKKKRRASAIQKPPREHLTEQEKKLHHIESEKKRRDFVKLGLEDLQALVPMSNSSLSRSGELVEAADFLQQLVEYNNTIREMIRDAHG
ncbi:hypothetical protein BDV95DRAFT_612757 [Massariosphaeria phaeospora]|uniref:BHLH domain-containing protein n=1 Tax=Massariosphaeria phaeospora TaxID=100035 RepID=A0A7C8I1D0_9PLEO|nr:hypothetical protein BDV95DRAFT_612757 [Massariosphaeria phaeospora]